MGVADAYDGVLPTPQPKPSDSSSSSDTVSKSAMIGVAVSLSIVIVVCMGVIGLLYRKIQKLQYAVVSVSTSAAYNKM
jgi:hypothetical protein